MHHITITFSVPSIWIQNEESFFVKYTVVYRTPIEDDLQIQYERNRNEFPDKEGFRSCLRRLWTRLKVGRTKSFTLHISDQDPYRKSIWDLSEFSDKLQFYLIPAGCTKDMQPIDQGLAARIHDIGKKVTSIKGLDKVVQETINEAWIKQVWAEVKRKATE